MSSNNASSKRLRTMNKENEEEEAGNTVLDFGKYKGTMIKQVAVDNFPYVREYLGNYQITDEPRVEDINLRSNVRDLIYGIWMNEQSIRENCRCGTRVVQHNPDCYGYCLGDTLKETARNVIHALQQETVTFNAAKRIGTVVWIRKHRRHVIKDTRRYLKNKCFECGKVLVPIGNARANGKDHADWNGRQFHKQCWKKLKDVNN